MGAAALFVLTWIAAQPVHAGDGCQLHIINAKAVGQDLGNLTTAGTVTGGGLLHGKIAGAITITGQEGNSINFTETVTFTTQQGTVTVQVSGKLDPAAGEFHASGPVIAATGKLSCASGSLTLTGQLLGEGIFTEDIAGFLCVDLAP
jgi:hypothetical protein